MTTPTAIEETILRKMLRGPVHSRTLHLVKAVVARLVERGLAQRVAGETVHRVYVAITDKGRAAIGEPPAGFRRAAIQIPGQAND